MENTPPKNQKTEGHASPFDEYPEAKVAWRKLTMVRPGPITVLFRALSGVIFALALLDATIVLILDIVHVFWPTLLDWQIKGGFSLILIGSAFLLLQLTLLRTPKNLLLGISVSVAFILWGTEQFLQNRLLVSLIDDLVVFLFVLDLSIVIRGYLKREIARRIN